LLNNNLSTIFASTEFYTDMKHQHTEEKNYDYLYYVIGLFFGCLTGAFLENGFVWIPVGGIVGLLFAALFLNVLVKGREQA